MQYLTTLAEHGLCCDKRIENSIEFTVNFLNEKENAAVLEGTLSKQPCSFGKVGQEDKWLTFYSLLASKHKTISLEA